MRTATITALLIIGTTALVPAQQPGGSTAGLQIDLPDVVAEVTAAHDRYNDAINARDDAVLLGSFRNDERTIRYGLAENLYGFKEKDFERQEVLRRPALLRVPYRRRLFQ